MTIDGGLPHGWTKAWRGLHVDAELKEEWLDRLNALPGLTVDITCAGHPDSREQRHPEVCFMVPPMMAMGPDERRAFVKATEAFLDHESVRRAGGAEVRWTADWGWLEDLPRLSEQPSFCVRALEERDLMTDEAFVAWWGAVIARLESLAA